MSEVSTEPKGALTVMGSTAGATVDLDQGIGRKQPIPHWLREAAAVLQPPLTPQMEKLRLRGHSQLEQVREGVLEVSVVVAAAQWVCMWGCCCCCAWPSLHMFHILTQRAAEERGA